MAVRVPLFDEDRVRTGVEVTDRVADADNERERELVSVREDVELAEKLAVRDSEVVADSVFDLDEVLGTEDEDEVVWDDVWDSDDVRDPLSDRLADAVAVGDTDLLVLVETVPVVDDESVANGDTVAVLVAGDERVTLRDSE